MDVWQIDGMDGLVAVHSLSSFVRCSGGAWGVSAWLLCAFHLPSSECFVEYKHCRAASLREMNGIGVRTVYNTRLMHVSEARQCVETFKHGSSSWRANEACSKHSNPASAWRSVCRQQEAVPGAADRFPFILFCSWSEMLIFHADKCESLSVSKVLQLLKLDCFLFQKLKELIKFPQCSFLPASPIFLPASNIVILVWRNTLNLGTRRCRNVKINT